MPEDVVHACALVLEEVATNIIKRDYDKNDERFIEIQLAVDGSGMFRMTVQNDGRPFNPLDARELDIFFAGGQANRGLDVHIVRNMMDEVLYERREGRNILTLLRRARRG